MQPAEVQWNQLMEVFNTNDSEVQETEWAILEWVWEQAIPSFNQTKLRKLRDHIRIVGQYNSKHWQLMSLSCVIPSIRAIAEEAHEIDLPPCFKCNLSRH